MVICAVVTWEINNYSKIISEAYIAAPEYFPTCSLSLKDFWNNFG